MSKNQKMGELSDFERGQIIGVHLVGVSVTKTASHIVRYIESDSFKGYVSIHGETTSAKRKNGRNQH
jgi:hypothetical protein